MLFFDDEYEAIPSNTQSGLERYIEKRIMPGGFLTAVLSNDLMGAVAHADSGNIHALPLIARFVYNRLPSTCHGSIQKMNNWCEAGNRDELFRVAQGEVEEL
jgi:hypothetical protein